MFAYLEILSGLLRYGPDARVFPNPYVGTVTFSASKQVAELKGLVIPPDRLLLPDGTIIETRRYSFGEYRDIKKALWLSCREAGLRPIFERARDITG